MLRRFQCPRCPFVPSHLLPTFTLTWLRALSLPFTLPTTPPALPIPGGFTHQEARARKESRRGTLNSQLLPRLLRPQLRATPPAGGHSLPCNCSLGGSGAALGCPATQCQPPPLLATLRIQSLHETFFITPSVCLLNIVQPLSCTLKEIPRNEDRTMLILLHS